MARYRKNRINEEVQRELCAILRDVKDPRVQKAMVTVTAVDVSADLKYAKAYYSTLGVCDEKEVADGIKSAAGFIRGQIARRLNLRMTPEFTFIKDQSAEHGAHIAALLKSVEADLKGDDSEGEGEGDK